MINRSAAMNFQSGVSSHESIEAIIIDPNTKLRSVNGMKRSMRTEDDGVRCGFVSEGFGPRERLGQTLVEGGAR
jgi:hypothetical protein